MKKLSYSSIFFIIVFFISCSNNEKQHPSNHVFIFSSSEDSLLSRIYIDKFLDKSDKFLPNKESYYDVHWIAEEDFSDYKDRPLILLIKLKGLINNQDDLYDSFFKNSKELNKVKFVDNFYSQNQSIIGIEAFDENDLSNILNDYSDLIINKINTTLDEQIFRKYKRIPQNDDIMNYILDKYKIQIFIDHNYQKIKEVDNVFWIGRGFPAIGDPYRWIAIREVDYHSSPKKYLNIIQETFNNYLLDSNYISLSNFDNRNTYKYRFEDNYFIGGTYNYSEIAIEDNKLDTIPTAGGPFISYVFNNAENAKSIIVTGLINNPGGEKMIYLKQLETVFKNIKYKGK